MDKTIHGARGNPEVRTVVHAHGVVSPPDSDGHPDAWFTRGFRETGPFFQRRIYRYPNTQRAATLWYHDHALGITRLNVYAGLAGFYLIRDGEELSLNLPRGNLEFPWSFRIVPLTGTARFFIRGGRNPPPPEFRTLPSYRSFLATRFW